MEGTAKTEIFAYTESLWFLVVPELRAEVSGFREVSEPGGGSDARVSETAFLEEGCGNG